MKSRGAWSRMEKTRERRDGPPQIQPDKVLKFENGFLFFLI
jgi:hypothetical protein